jgi:hypothetical protein
MWLREQIKCKILRVGLMLINSDKFSENLNSYFSTDLSI